MQIRNSYTSFQNRDYQESHTHHITKCLLEEQPKKKTGGGGPSRAAEAGTKAMEASERNDSYYMDALNSAAKKGSGRGKATAVRGFWDALGEEGAGDKKNVMTIFKENFLPGIQDAAVVLQNGFGRRIADRIRNVREKIKTGAGNALGKFKRNKETFTALTGEQTSSGQKKSAAKEKTSDGHVTAAKTEENIPVQIQSHNYLMDSYNRRGEYSQLNDNLTYQKPEK